jgi:hypothetical protein
LYEDAVAFDARSLLLDIERENGGSVSKKVAGPAFIFQAH